MRAGRLVELLLLIQRRGRMTAAEIAGELEVSPRTVLRDIEALSGAGVPIRTVRGRDGGFELMEGYSTELDGPDQWTPAPSRPAATRRGTVRISPDGRRLAAVLARLQPLRVRRAVEPDEHGWVEATFRLGPIEASALDILSLGPEIEAIAPPPLRRRVAELARRTASHYHGVEGTDATAIAPGSATPPPTSITTSTSPL